MELLLPTQDAAKDVTGAGVLQRLLAPIPSNTSRTGRLLAQAGRSGRCLLSG